MAFSPGPKDKAIPISVFGSLVTLEPPQSLPNGVSPDNSDCQFTPGAVFSRACLKKYLATPLGSVAINYAKTYIDPTNIVRNFYLDAAGNFWMQVVAPAGLAAAPTVIFTTTPGSYARSTTAFGREYVAISDGFRGTEAPLQITGLTDGTVQIDRVTHDAPGAAPVVTNLIIPSVALAASASGLSLTLVSATLSGYFAPGGYYTTVIYTVASGALGLNPAGSFTISGNTNSVFNGVGGIISIPNDTTIIGGFYSTTAQSGTGGTLVGTGNVSLIRQGNVVTATTAAAHQLQVGYQAQISGVAAAAIGGGVASIVVDNENAPGIGR